MSEQNKDGQLSSGEGEMIGVSPDHPADVDKIGFHSYTEALRILLTHQTTDPPLTISVEGPWGSGKTSFMRQLATKLEDSGHRTVEFNPWRHESEEALWAAFVLEFLRQLRSKDDFNLRDRLGAEISLYRMRLKINQNLSGILLNIIKLLSVLLLTVGGLTAFFTVAPDLLTAVGANTRLVRFLLGSGGLLGAIAAIVTISKSMKSQVINPIRPDIGKYITDPDYQGRQAFITKFHKDFDQIIKAYTKGEERVFVFIDDLDRCEVPKAADLMQSINLLIESRPNVIFVIGIDRQKVASGIAAKHEDILPYITHSETTTTQDSNSASSASGISFGYDYLEKFIQLPFQVPEAKEKDMQSLLTPTEMSETEHNNNSQAERDIEKWVKEELFSDDSDLFDQMSEMVIPSLDNNPRRVKKFGNLYRLQAILASQESILQSEYVQGFDPKLTLEQLAKFVVIRIQWRQFASVISARPNVVVELEEYAIGEKKLNELSAIAEQWANDRKLIELLRFGVDQQTNSEIYCSYEVGEQEELISKGTTFDPVRSAYSLQNVDLNNLIRISPIIEEPEEPEETDKTKYESKDSESTQDPDQENIKQQDAPNTNKTSSEAFPTQGQAKVDYDDEQIKVLRQEIHREHNKFFCNPDNNKNILEFIQFLLDNSNQDWEVDELAKQLDWKYSEITRISEDLSSGNILDIKEEKNDIYYTINENNKIIKTISNISNDVSGKGFKRRIKILSTMANLPSTTIPGELFIEEFGWSKNSIHHHQTQLKERGIVRDSRLEGKIGARYRFGMKLNTKHETAQNLIELVG